MSASGGGVCVVRELKGVKAGSLNMKIETVSQPRNMTSGEH